MYNDPRRREFEDKAKEALFLKRLADLQASNARFPWTAGEAPKLDIPMEESKLHADRAVEGNISDAELEHRALIDLTSLSFSFKLFYKRFHYEIQRASRYKRPLSMCLVAVDELEDIARVCGSHSKTAVIEHAARVLLRSIRDVDIAGRCREDCFGIILPETPVAGAEIAAVRIRTKMEQLEINDLNRPVQITVSIGGCSFPENGALVEELFAHTAQSLMSVVKKGGNSISFG